MKRLYIWSIIFVVLLGVLGMQKDKTQEAEEKDEEGWLNYEDGIEQIKDSDKPGIIYFRTEKDKDSDFVKAFEEEIFKDNRVEALLEVFILIKVDYEAEKKVAKKYRIKKPAVFIVCCEQKGKRKKIKTLKKIKKIKERKNELTEEKFSKYLEDTLEMLGKSRDKLVEISQPVVKVFEGSRQPLLKSWTYVLHCPKTKEAAVVDPSCNPDEFEKYIKEHKLKVKYIFISHGHQDHCVTLGEIMGKCRGAQILRFGLLKDNQYVKIGRITLKVFHTPGHNHDCIVLWTGNMLFTGDSLCHEDGGAEVKKRLNGNFIMYAGHGRCQKRF